MERNFRAGKLPVIAKYGGALASQYRVPVKTLMLLLDRKGNPKFDQGTAEFRVGETRILHPFRILRLWELDPAPLFAAGDPRLLPWTAMMKSTDRELRAAARELGRLGDEELLGRFHLLAGFRYDRDQIEEMTGGANMGFVEFFWENSKLLTEYKAKIATDSLAEGIEKGAVGEARRLLKALLASKFPGLEALPQLDKIKRVKALENLLLSHVFGGKDHAAVKQAILKAARRSAT